MDYTTVLVEYANAHRAASVAAATKRERTVQMFKGLNEWAVGQTFSSVERKLASVDADLPKLIAGSPATFSRNLTVGQIMGSTGADDVAVVKSLVNKYAALGVGLKDMRFNAREFEGNIEEFEDTVLKPKVSTEDEVESLKAKLATLNKQARKIRARIAELENSSEEETF